MYVQVSCSLTPATTVVRSSLYRQNITRGNQHRSRPRDSPPRQDACEGRSTQRRKIRKLGGFSARSIPSCTRPSWSSTNSRNDQDATSAASASDLLRVLRVLLWLSSSKTKGKADEDSQQEEVKVERKAPSALDVSGRAFRKDLQVKGGGTLLCVMMHYYRLLYIINYCIVAVTAS